VPLNLLAFPSAAAARQAVLAGNIPCAMLAAPEVMAGLRDDRLVGLGLAREERSPLLPEVPTLSEQGIALVLAAHRGFALTAGIDMSFLQSLVVVLRSVITDPEFAALCQSRGYIPAFIGPNAWEILIRRTVSDLSARWIGDPWILRRD